MNSPKFDVSCSLSATSEFGEILIRPSLATPIDAARFEHFVHHVKTLPSDTPGLVAAKLVAFDSVKPSQLAFLTEGTNGIYQAGNFAYLEWVDQEDERYERRALSDLTQRTISAQQRSRSDRLNSGEKLRDELADLLCQVNGYSSLTKIARLDRLEGDAISWWYTKLPLVFLGHLSGLQKFSAVPSSTLMRQQSGQVIARASEGKLEASVTTTSSGRADGMLDAFIRSSGEDPNTAVLLQVMKALTFKKTDTNARAKRRWLDTLETYEERAARAGPLTCMSLAWLADMAEDGTIEATSPVAKTIKKYFSIAVEPLLTGLNQLPPDLNKWELEALESMYRSILKNTPESSQRTMAAALTNFHYFLFKHFEFPWLASPLHPKFKSRVKANVIWPHEVERALGWLAGVPDPRLAEPAALALLLASVEPIRWDEFLRLRIQNIDFEPGLMTIEITPSKKYGRLKTKSSQRVLDVADENVIGRFRSWVAQRRAEGASGDSLLLGDPRVDNRIYRQYALHSLVNTVLKASTGDDQCTHHTLRHSVTSFHAHTILSTDSENTPDRWRVLAVRTGHSQPGMTILSYCHLYEEALRSLLDKAADLTNDSTLRLQPREELLEEPHIDGAHTPVAGVLALIMRIAEMPPAFPPLSTRFKLQDAQAPQFASWKGIVPSVEQTWWLLTRLAAGWGMEQVAHLYGLTPQGMTMLRDVAIEVIDEIARRSFPRKNGRRAHRSVDITTALFAASIDLSRATQPKYLSLSEWFQRGQDDALVLQACEAWLSCRHGEYISLTEPNRILSLYKLLRSTGIHASLFRVCVPDVHKVTWSEVVALVQTDFITGFSVSPRQCIVNLRLGRPSCYLQIDATAHGDPQKSAGGSTVGLDAWLASAWIHIKWRKKLLGRNND